MLYLIDGKYYIRVAPFRYTEVIVTNEDGKGHIHLTKNRIEVSNNTVILSVDLQAEANKIKNKSDKVPKESLSDKYKVKPRYNRYNK